MVHGNHRGVDANADRAIDPFCDGEELHDVAESASERDVDRGDRADALVVDVGLPDADGSDVGVDHLRRRHLDTISIDGSPHAQTPDAIEATSFDVAVQQESALDELEARELGTAIERAIAGLRPEYRSCIMLRHVEGRSYEEIAATLDLPLGTVKTYIHRARHELRRALEHLRS